jgi:ribosomal protein S6--L-glutamate ligase
VRVGVIGIPGGWSTEALAEAIEARTGFRHVVDMEQVSIDTGTGALLSGDLDLRTLDGLILKKIGRDYSPHLLDRLEMLRYISETGVRMFSDPNRVLDLIDRLSCTVTLRRAGIPMPETTVTESVEHAVRAIQRYRRAVLKPLYSTKARGMTVIEAGSEREVRAKVREFQAQENPVIYVQRMIDGIERDLGVVFLGDEYLGTYARVKGKGAWNTTTHSGGRYEAQDPSPESLEVARRAQHLFGLDFSSVDVVETDRGPLVFEVSAFGGFRGIYEACRINAAERLTDYVLSRVLAAS